MEVVWKRETQRGPEELPGMGLKFTRVPDETVVVVGEVVDREPGIPE
jgi:hypothetical protein